MPSKTPLKVFTIVPISGGILYTTVSPIFVRI